MTGWPAVVTALSTLFIALAMLAFVLGHLLLARQWTRVAERATRLLDTLDRDARPALNSARSAAEDAGRIVTLLRSEVEGITGVSRDVRDRVQDVSGRFGQRLEDLEALVDVLQDEVEDTVLDVAAALRTTRRGTGILRTMKRAFRRT